MNEWVTAITLGHLYLIFSPKVGLKKADWLLILAGAVLPAVDDFRAWLAAKPGLLFKPAYFHSLTSWIIVLSVMALLHWVYYRESKRALRLYLPLLGLLLNFLHTLFSTERAPFFEPFTSATLNLNLAITGYPFVVAFALLIWGTKKWSGIKLKVIANSYLIFLCLFLISMASFHLVIRKNLPSDFDAAQKVNILPANLAQTKWNVVGIFKDRYRYNTYSLVKNWGGNSGMLLGSNDFDLTQALLEDPEVYKLYAKSFHHPVIQTKFQNDILQISISELLPLKELVWTKKIMLSKNSSGRILAVEPEYKFFE